MLFPLPGLSFPFLCLTPTYPLKLLQEFFLWFSTCPASAGLCPHFCCHYNTQCISLLSLGQEKGRFCPWLHDSHLTCSLTGGGLMDGVSVGRKLSTLSPAPPFLLSLGAGSPRCLHVLHSADKASCRGPGLFSAASDIDSVSPFDSGQASQPFAFSH